MKKRAAFDIVGSVAIVEIPPKDKEKEIAKQIVKTHPHIKTVCKKVGGRKGKLRLRKLKVILGKKTETIHTEHGCRFRLDVAKVYFSPREATERQRIAEKVKAGETVLVMFAGAGPYAIIIGRAQPDAKVYAIELNRAAYKYMEENIELNRLKYQVIPICGDVKKESKSFYGKCDRVVMPLPKEGYKYLSVAIKCLKPKGIVHFYSLGPGENLFGEAIGMVKKECSKLGKRAKILGKQKVLPYAPGAWKVRIDFGA